MVTLGEFGNHGILETGVHTTETHPVSTEKTIKYETMEVDDDTETERETDTVVKEKRATNG